MIVKESTLVKMSYSMLIPIAIGLVTGGVVYATLNDKVSAHEKQIDALEVRFEKVEDMHTDIAVIKSEVIEIHKRLDRAR